MSEITEFRKEVRELFGEMSQNFAAIDPKFEEVDRKFDSIDKRFDKMDQRFDKMDQRFDKMDQRIDALDRKIDYIDRKYDERCDRIVEGIAKELRSTIGILASEDKRLDDRITKIEESHKIYNNAQEYVVRLEAVELEVGKHTEQIRDLQAHIV